MSLAAEISRAPAPAADGAAKAEIIIIGGGVAGLACGCYLQMNGYRTVILETNRDPGGLCVAWDRGPYVFDGCLRWLAGMDPSSIFHRVWTELGAIAGRQIVNESELLRIEGVNGESFAVAADLDRLRDDFKRIAPEDAPRIDRLIRAARRCAPLDPPGRPLELMSAPEKTRLLFRYFPMLPVIFRWKNVNLADYIATFRNPFLREVLLAIAGDSRMSALVLVMVLAIRCGRNAGFVAGGSRAFSEAIADRYTNLGGLIRYNTHAASIGVENARATGVRCTDGTFLAADTVISCADGRTTIFKMLEGRFVDRRIRHAYKHFELFSGVIQASFGVAGTFADAPSCLSLQLRPPLAADDVTQVDRIEVSLFGADSEFCPPGKSVVIVRFAGHYEYWKELKSREPAAYRSAKARLAQELIQILNRRLPGLASLVEYTDMATPASFERWTGNWRGSYQGWLPTPKMLGRRIPRTLPGLKNFYMAGHWVEAGGGLPPAALSGRYVAQIICARDKKTFTTTDVAPRRQTRQWDGRPGSVMSSLRG